MGMSDAVRSGLSNYANFKGRATRPEYWWFALFTAVVGGVAALTDSALDVAAAVPVVALALLIPGLAVGTRRLHDVNRTGWWYLLTPVPGGSIALLVFLLLPGTAGVNRYGPPPLNHKDRRCRECGHVISDRADPTGDREYCSAQCKAYPVAVAAHGVGSSDVSHPDAQKAAASHIAAARADK